MNEEWLAAPSGEGLSNRLATLQTIGEVARRYGLTLRALRFYEDRGLVTPLRHGTSRFYDQSACERLDAILYGKKLGLTLSEIASRMAQHTNTDGTPMLLARPNEVTREIERLEDKRSTIDEAIGALRATLAQLREPGIVEASVG